MQHDTKFIEQIGLHETEFRKLMITWVKCVRSSKNGRIGWRWKLKKIYLSTWLFNWTMNIFAQWFFTIAKCRVIWSIRKAITSYNQLLGSRHLHEGLYLDNSMNLNMGHHKVLWKTKWTTILCDNRWTHELNGVSALKSGWYWWLTVCVDSARE